MSRNAPPGPSPKAHSCPNCAKSFSSAIAWADHGRSTGHFIPCTISGCKKKFKCQQSLKQHVESGIHAAARSNQPQDSTQQTPAPPIRKEPTKPKQTASITTSGFSKTDNIASSSGTSRASTNNKPATGPVSSKDDFIINVYKESPGATGVSTAHLVIPIQTEANSVNGHKQPSPPALGAQSKQRTPGHAQPTTGAPQPVTDTPLPGSYAQYDITNCYLIATPRNGGNSLVHPLMIDYNGADLEFSLLLPTQQKARPTNVANLGSCKTCSFTFTSWASLTLHFKYSKCSNLSARLPNEAPVKPSKPLEEVAILGNKPTTYTDIPKPQSVSKSNTQPFRAQPKRSWSTIHEPQRLATLGGLIQACHSHTTLTKNKYASGPGYSRNLALGADIALSLIPMPTPVHDPRVPKRSAVALDCEMVGVLKGESEVARLSAIDCLNGEVLIDTFVQPTRTVTDWRTKHSGITKPAMTAAVAEGQTLKGWPAARAELYKYIDCNTILVGHALQNDFHALRMQHWRVVDSAILARDAVGNGVSRQWGLKTLCAQFLNLEIQNNGKKGHDSVEDAFAAREVVLWCVGHNKELVVWGKKQREEFLRKKKEMAAKKANKARQKASLGRVSRYPVYSSGDDEDVEVFRFQDMVEEYDWPEGWDPWSD